MIASWVCSPACSFVARCEWGIGDRDLGLRCRCLRTRLVDPRAYITDRMELCEVRGDAMAVRADTAGVEAGSVGGE